MKRSYLLSLCLMLLLGLTAILFFATCGEAGASCEESCEDDNDCATDLACVQGQCYPEVCKTCAENGRSCAYEINTSDQEQGADKECFNAQCI